MNHFDLSQAVLKHTCNAEKCAGKYLKNELV